MEQISRIQSKQASALIYRGFVVLHLSEEAVKYFYTCLFYMILKDLDANSSISPRRARHFGVGDVSSRKSTIESIETSIDGS